MGFGALAGRAGGAHAAKARLNLSYVFTRDTVNESPVDRHE
jgi:hypothetical protein